MAQRMLTTVDNPFSPFTQFDEWLQYDMAAGYDTSGMLARVAMVSDDMSERDQDLVIDDAIQEIVDENITGLYRIVENSENSV